MINEKKIELYYNIVQLIEVCCTTKYGVLVVLILAVLLVVLSIIFRDSITKVINKQCW